MHTQTKQTYNCDGKILPGSAAEKISMEGKKKI